MMVPRAVLFDFDGVIADSENHHVAAWQRTLSTLGWQIPDEVAARSAEVDDRVFIRELFRDRGILEGDVEGWIRKKQDLVVTLLRDSPRLYPGVRKLVAFLQGQVRLAVVSGTWRENVDVVLSASRLSGAFEFIVGKEDVSVGKPSPEAYHLALRRLGLKAGEVVAIEDSPTGLASARAAGIQVIAVGHRRPYGLWVGESLYVTGFEPIESLLHHLGLSQSA